MIYSIETLFNFKKSSVAFLLGSGQSINSISKFQWSVIKKHDVWAVNNWVYHPRIVPDFYHIEAKKYNFEILQRRFIEKQAVYKYCKFIFPKNKTLKLRKRVKVPLHTIVPDASLKFEYRQVGRDVQRTHRPFNANYKINANILTKSYDMSMTTIFELMYKFKYEIIVLFGIDLFNSYYFWTHKPYGEIHHQTNKEHENRNPTDPHNTVKIKDFIVDFNKRWMMPEGRGIFVGHTATLLHPELEVVNLGAFV